MQIEMRGSRVAIEKTKKSNKTKSDMFIVLPESEEYVGVVKYIGPDVKDIKVGQKVYFTTEHSNMRILGIEYCVMNESSIVAVVNEEKQD